MTKKIKSIHGIGLNDASYTVKPEINGKVVVCPFYQTWKDMITRCYSEKFQQRQPTYIGCSVAKEWLTFSNFKKWMESQDWRGKQLDKDILVKGNKSYSADNCVFVDAMTNVFPVDRASLRGDWPIGVCWNKQRNMFVSHCKNPFTKRMEHLGLFSCPQKAHLAWKKRKHELACQLAELQTDERVAAALRLRYA